MASFKTEDQHCCIACFQLLTMDLKQIPHFYLSNVWCWAQDSVCRLGLSGTEDSFYTEGRLYISELDLSKWSTCIIYMMMICSPLYSQYYMTIVFSFFSLKKNPLIFIFVMHLYLHLLLTCRIQEELREPMHISQISFFWSLRRNVPRTKPSSSQCLFKLCLLLHQWSDKESHPWLLPSETNLHLH